MKVKLAKAAGFCMGVRRAMEIVLTETNKGEDPIYTFGPLIHNKQVLDLLASKGVTVLESLEDLDDKGEGMIVIRAHGIPPQERTAIKETGLKIIDATCPRVAKVHGIIRSYTRKGYSGVIVGDRDHSEVRGLAGYGNDRMHVIESVDDIPALPDMGHAFVVAQTTQNEQTYRELVNALKVRFPEILVFNTICNATHDRQEATRSFAGHVDAVVVVGGYHSANTQRLVEVSREEGIPTFHVETKEDLDKKSLSGLERIGVTAGASTPNWMIKDVAREIERIRSRSETWLGSWVRGLFHFLVLSNIAVGAGAFFLAYAASVISRRNIGLLFPYLSFFYVYAMHVMNLFLDKGASAYNDPDRAAFLRKNRRLLIVTGVFATAIVLVLSLTAGMMTFLTVAALCLLGAAYSIHLVPDRFQRKWHYSRIKDIPGSRSLSEALAWMVIITLVPLLSTPHIIWSAAIISALFVFMMSYTRSALFDIFQVQGDLIVGAETLPVTLGERRTLGLLKIVLLGIGIVMGVSPVLGLVGPFSYIMLLPLSTLSFCVIAYERRWIYPGTMMEALVEANSFLAGLLALVWQAA